MEKKKQRIGIGLFAVILSALLSQTVYADKSVKNKNKTYFSDAYWAGHNDDFSKNGTIDSDDYNYGWEIGKFCISGYSSRIADGDGNYIFLKNVGDEINLTFLLEQDIHILNGSKNYYIRELDSRDEYFQTERIHFGHGALIIRYIDYQGIKHDPVIYTDYLAAVGAWVESKVSVEGPDTSVYLLEEGDYEVALDYRVAKKKGGPLFIDPKDPYQDYRIYFKFGIRNGNCMSFIRDAKTGNELTNESVTQNGFILDMANSKYLQVSVKKEVMADGRNGLIEDVRFNRPVSDGESFLEEGIYTLTTKNIYTNESIVKKIYVGSDLVMIAFVNSNYSIPEINDMLAQGATISEDGQIIMPVLAEVTHTETTPQEDMETGNTASEPDNTEAVNKKNSGNTNAIGKIIAILTTLMILTVSVGLMLAKRRKLTMSDSDAEAAEDGCEASEENSQEDALSEPEISESSESPEEK